MALPFTCFSCGESDTDENNFISCAYCFRCQHLSCKGVFGAAVASLRQKTYFCSAECSSIHHSTATALGMDKRILDAIEKVSSDVNEIKQTHNSLDRKLDSVLDEVKSMKLQFNTLKTDVELLQDEHDSMNETVNKLQLDLDRINRAAIANNAILLGVPAVENENVCQLVQKIASVIGCDLPQDAVVEAARLVSKESEQLRQNTAPIRVVFSKLEHKESLFTKKKLHGLLQSSALDPSGTSTGGTRIIVRDEMTSFGMNLLKEARSVKDKVDLKHVWAGRNGVVLVKRTDNSKVEKIRNLLDIQELQRTHTKRKLDESLFHSTSVIDEPQAKR